jgi:hypothetical protein
MKKEKFIEKMEKISPYLPYDLRFKLTKDSHEDYDLDLLNGNDEILKEGSIFTLTGYIPDEMGNPFDFDGFVFSKLETWVSDNLCFKPILRPLSVEELKKYIYINSWREINLFNELQLEKHRLDIIKEDCWIDFLSYNSIKKLIQYHFDVFCMIPKGEAISIYDI